MSLLPIALLTLALLAFAHATARVRRRYVYLRRRGLPVGRRLMFLERTRQYLANEPDPFDGGSTP